MANITIGNINGGGAAVNPTTHFVPVNAGGYFGDSTIYDDGTRLYAEDTDGWGMEFDYDGNTAKLGDVNSNLNKTLISLDDSANQIYITGDVNTFIDVNGADDKIALQAKNGSNYIEVDGIGNITTLKNTNTVFQTDNLIFVGSVTSGTVGAPTSTYLVITINSASYKIPLFNP